MEVKVINRSDNALPTYETPGSAGLDLRANLEVELSFEPLDRKLVPTGLFIELPEGYEAQIRPRSGLSLKKGLTLVNTPGTIDSDYRGEIKVIMINLSSQAQVVRHGERIAQMVISKYEQVKLTAAESISDSLRGRGGFGHTGSS